MHLVGFIIRITKKGLGVVLLNNIRLSIHSRLWREQDLKLWYVTHLGSARALVRAGSGRSVLILLASCMTYTIAVCTVKNS